MAGLPASLRFGPAPSKAPRAAAGGASPTGGGRQAQSQPRDAAAAWAAECERVAPQLIITLPSDAGTAPADWRPQLERARAALEALQTAGPAAQAEVAAARAGLAAGAEQLAAAEVEASAQLAPLREEHRAATAAVAVLQQEEAGRREYVAQLEGELAYLNKELEERQAEVAQQGDSMSDTRPVARLAAACTQLQRELAEMEVRQGVLQAMLLGAA